MPTFFIALNGLFLKRKLVDFAHTNDHGLITYKADKTPDVRISKKSYVQLVSGDGGKQYLVGQGYCLRK